MSTEVGAATVRLEKFISANPLMDGETWRQELVAGEVVPVAQRPAEVSERSIIVLNALAGCARRAKGGPYSVVGGSGVGRKSEAADDFRIADVLVWTPSRKSKRREVSLIAAVMVDPDAMDDADRARLEVYRGQAAVKEILLFAARKPVCVVHRHVGGAWSEDRYAGADGTIRLLSLKVPLAMLSVYPDDLS